MKKTTLYLGASFTLVALVAAGLLINNNEVPSSFPVRASSSVIYKHYNAIAPTDNEHGCVEFWVSCSDYSFLLEEPTEGTIVEGGDITDNPSFDWDGMDVFDDRFVPSVNKQKEWGMVPVLDSANNRITYGLYPQTYVSDSATYNALDALPSSAIYDVNGYYYYNGSFYQNCIGVKRDDDNHFSDGTKVVDGAKYWFKCEPISWVIMTNSNSNYLVYSENGLHGSVLWGYTSSDIYANSQVRDFLNGTGTSYADNGFFQSAFYNSNQYVKPMTFSLDDGSSNITDNVRLLLHSEAENTAYFANDAARRCPVSDWTAAHRVCFKNGTEPYARWWLCEGSTKQPTCAYGVGINGDIGEGGPKITNQSGDRALRMVVTIRVA